ncbi:hypothetical protein [Glutamicibacter sp. BW77]|uniref:hypothetical protein n=1 Tax=Glutamicibacter sp. BW77 TaxID=2024402 RepID=UPI000BB6F670|nr:hypothetical protein [Glutamicibacter sp. BW77]PCC31457.1 hypothetical protein CIK74_17435 [Glutamicibacter sp. BW77]
MIDLPVATRQPYPSKNPWYDVSQYLAGGLTPYADQSVISCADGNFVHYSFHIRIDRQFQDPDYVYLFRSMHPSLKVAANGKASGWFGSDVHGVEFGTHGWIAMPIWRSQGITLADYGMVFLNLTAARSKP